MSEKPRKHFVILGFDKEEQAERYFKRTSYGRIDGCNMASLNIKHTEIGQRLEVLNSLSLFSGYGGLDLAIEKYAKPVLYCEKELYAKAVLLSRMDDGALPFAPIWSDVTTLDGTKLRGLVDIITGGFPCQDISVAGHGAGLEGKRSGLFYEVVRLTSEIRPTFVFLENVPAIRIRGLEQVVKEFTQMGYDCRWTMLSASSIGAPHKRERWFFLAHSKGERRPRLSLGEKKKESLLGEPRKHGSRNHWEDAESGVGRVVDGVENWSHRIKILGNGVVPQQAEAAFIRLMGLDLKR